MREENTICLLSKVNAKTNALAFLLYKFLFYFKLIECKSNRYKQNST